MKMSSKLAWSFLLVLMAAPGALAQLAGGIPPSSVEVVAVGEIRKIDAENRTFDVRSRVPEMIGVPGTARDDRWHGEIHVGVTIGGSTRESSGTPPGGQPADRRMPPDLIPIPVTTAPNEPPLPRAGGYTMTTVRINDETVIVQDGKELAFADLKVGNRVTVSGPPVGDKKMVARKVERTRSPLDD